MPKLTFQYVQREIPETLLEFLVRRFRYHDVLEWEERISQGYVKIDGRKTKPTHLLETRNLIVYHPPPAPEPPVDTDHRILHEDEHILAVAKSGNIPTSPSGKYWNHCLIHFLKREYRLPYLYAVHRLDRETSGVNLFGKSKAAAAFLGREFSQGRVKKKYMAIVEGRFPGREAYVSAPLRDAREGKVRIRQEVHAAGRPASTRFALRAILPGASLVEAQPITGRTHQIRAHLAYLGYPVWGDKLYGQKEDEFISWLNEGERTAENRQLLHAHQLTFAHPAAGKPMTVDSSPAVLLELFNRVGQNTQTNGVFDSSTK